MILMKTGMHYEPAAIYLVCVLYGPSRPVCPTQVGHWAACEAIQEPDIQRSWAPTALPPSWALGCLGRLPGSGQRLQLPSLPTRDAVTARLRQVGSRNSDFESPMGAAHRRSTDHERFFSYVPISSLRASTCLADAASNCALPSRGESGRTTSRAYSLKK
jgi:hypothetical protein